MSEVPSNLIPTRVTQLPYAPVASEESLLLIVYEGNTYQIMAGDLLQVAGVPTSRQVIAGTGMAGGGALSSNVTLSIAPGGVGSTQLANSGVTSGVYGSATEVPVFTVDAKGRVTAATTIPVTVSGYVPNSRQVIAGEGLNGGGALNNNVTLNANLSNSTPLAGNQTGAAGSSTDISRADHTHPAVDLSDDNEVDGILGLSNGGTAKSLVAAAGAIIWSGADGLYVGPVGVSGQVLQSTGAGEYVWVDQSNLNVGRANNLSGGAANRLAVQTAPNTTGFVSAPSVTDTFLKWNGSSLIWDAVAGAGTVTSVAVSGGTTGLTTSGGPITSAGTITLGGTLIPANGGTGISSYAVGDLLFANTTTSLDKLTVGSNGYLLASNGTAPAYVNPTSVTIGTATNLAGGAGGSIPYQSSAGTTTFLASGTGVLTASGGNPSYTMSPSLTQVTVAGDPTTNLQVATKQYVDTLVSSGITYHTPVKYEVPDTTGNLNATYNNGTAGVGATLTNAGTLGAFTPDGTVAQVGDRILIYNQTNAYENGVYTVTTVGSGSVAWVLTRSTDTDSYALKDPNGLGEGDAFFITSGVTGAGETYVCNTSGTITFGTTAITFVQVSATQVYSAGTGLTLTGTTFSLTAPVATSLGGTGLSSFTSGGAVYATSTSALTTGTLPVTAGGTGATTLSSGYLVKGNGTSAVSASVVYDNGTNVGIGTSSVTPYFGTTVRVYNAGNGGTLQVSGSSVTGGFWASEVLGLATVEATTNHPLTFGTNATERMRITSTGDVGIGTTNPISTLDVTGSSGITTTSGGNTARIVAAASGTFFGSTTNTAVIFQTNQAEKMRIDSSGNVGIGTSSPAYKLDVNGTSYFSDNMVLSRTNTAGSTSGITITNAGTSASYAGLNINSGTVSSQFFNDAAGNAVVAGAVLRTTSNHPLVIGTNNTERMRITSTGNVGIGTSSPSAKLHVSGAAARLLVDFSGDNYYDAATHYFRNYASTATSYISVGTSSTLFSTNTTLPLTLGTNNTERMRLDASGNVGIGTSSPTTKLDVSGTVKATAFTGIDGGTF